MNRQTSIRAFFVIILILFSVLSSSLNVAYAQDGSPSEPPVTEAPVTEPPTTEPPPPTDVPTIEPATDIPATEPATEATSVTGMSVAEATSTTTETPAATLEPTATSTPIPPPPSIDFTCVDLGLGKVQCIDNSTGTIDGRAWDFSGTYYDNLVVQHSFTAQGNYYIDLTIWGAGEWITSRKTVNVVFPLVANFTVATDGTALPVTVDLTNTSIGQDTVLWEFDDGTTSVELNPSHIFTTEGIHPIKLTITGAGGTRSLTQTVVIGNILSESLQPSFTASLATCNAPCTVIFVNTSSGPVLTQTWDAGNGVTSTDSTFTYTYTEAGTYAPALTISDGVNFANVTGQIIVYPEIVAPKASFTTSITSTTSVISCQAPCLMNFTDTSTGDITSWLWSLGNEGEFSSRNLTHSFTQEGVYSVILTVKGPVGVDEHAVTIYVSSPPSEVTAAFTPLYNQYPNPLTVLFDSTLSVGPITSYSWDFGDGQTSADAIPFHTYANEGTYQVKQRVTDANGNFSETIQPVRNG